MINTAIVPKFGGKVEAEEIGLPVSSNVLFYLVELQDVGVNKLHK